MKELIKNSRLTIKEFAEEYKIPYNTVRQWANGEREAPAYIKNLIEENRNLKTKGEQLTIENPIKKLIEEVQETINRHYDYNVFGKGSMNKSSEEIDEFINNLGDLQTELEMLYRRWGFEFRGSYEKKDLKQIDK